MGPANATVWPSSSVMAEGPQTKTSSTMCECLAEVDRAAPDKSSQDLAYVVLPPCLIVQPF
jgi:hypothetical protein